MNELVAQRKRDNERNQNKNDKNDFKIIALISQLVQRDFTHKMPNSSFERIRLGSLQLCVRLAHISGISIICRVSEALVRGNFVFDLYSSVQRGVGNPIIGVSL